MSVDYNAMSIRELKRYMLDHRDDEKIFSAYMDRRHARPKKVLITAQDAKLPLAQTFPKLVNLGQTGGRTCQ
jgi:hypothetical protein